LNPQKCRGGCKATQEKLQHRNCEATRELFWAPGIKKPYPYYWKPRAYYAGPSNSQNPNYNSQLSQITVNDLLHHAGGWNRDNGPYLEGYDTNAALKLTSDLSYA
jgi:hypothetical protein